MHFPSNVWEDNWVYRLTCILFSFTFMCLLWANTYSEDMMRICFMNYKYKQFLAVTVSRHSIDSEETLKWHLNDSEVTLKWKWLTPQNDSEVTLKWKWLHTEMARVKIFQITLKNLLKLIHCKHLKSSHAMYSENQQLKNSIIVKWIRKRP